MRRLASGTIIAAGTVTLAAFTSSAPRPVQPRTVWDSVYTMNQAARGESSYAKTCARCHGASLSGGDQAPALAGSTFLGNWNGVSLAELHDRILKTMPSDSVGIYNKQLVSDVVAFLLKANGFPAGANELRTESDSLKDIILKTER